MTTYRHAEGGLGALETANLDPVGPNSPLVSPASGLSRDAEPGLFNSPLASGSHGPSSRMGLQKINRQRSGNGNGNGGDAKSVSWGDLPRKQQLAVLTLARLSEPLVQTSLQSYMFYQLKWFDPSLPDSVISSQAGILHASFTAAQFLTAMLWGRVADSSLFGRKTVLLIGLGGTLLSCVGFGFSTSFWQALVFRSIGGITNGNVGVLRTMISEIVREKKRVYLGFYLYPYTFILARFLTIQDDRYQSRAFLLLPMTYNIGVIIGPILGGVLSDLAGTYPDLFGDVEFFKRYPYATPNLLSAFFLFSAMISTWLCLDETLETRLGRRDRGRELGRKLWQCFFRNSLDMTYTRLPSRDGSDVDAASQPPSRRPSHPSLADDLDKVKQLRPRYTQRLGFRRIFTRNVVFTLLASSTIGFHIGTFNSLWFVFLSTPVYDPAKPPESPDALTRNLPFIFTGGMGLQPREVGMAMAILGVLGISLQLTVYPWLSARLGTVRSWRIFLLLFPFTYFLVPFLSLVSSSSGPPQPKDGVRVWISIAAVLAMQVIGRTFALPAQTILVNNCTPHPSVLGTLHGIAQSVSSLARTIGPVFCGFLYGYSLAHGVIGVAWWVLSGIAVCGFLTSLLVWEGDGHEIWLEGDEEEI